MNDPNQEQQAIISSAPSAAAITTSSRPDGAIPLPLDEHCVEFLPDPGPWTSLLGRILLAAVVSGGVALVFWPLQETVRAAGSLRPTGENTQIQSEMGGTVLAVQFRPNQVVARGAILALLDPAPLKQERQQLLNEMAALNRQEVLARQQQQSLQAQADSLHSLSTALTESSRREVDQVRASLAFNRSELERYRSLLASGAVARNLVEEKLARARVSEAELLKAEQGVAEQQARGWNELARLRQSASQARSAADDLSKQVFQRQVRLEQLDRAIQRSVLRAPLAGSVVSTTLHHPGEVVRAGDVVATLAPLDQRLEVKLQVPARDISQLRPGQKASLRVSACPTPEFGVLPARLLSVSADTLPGSDPSRDGGYQVLLQPQRRSLQGRQGPCLLRQGMDVVGDIVTRRTTVLAYLLNKLHIDPIR